MKVGVLTGGGDCPGLNPAIRAIVYHSIDYGFELVGLRRGWAGLVEADTCPLNLEMAEGLISQGGTVLESSRTNPFKRDHDLKAAIANFKELGLDALIALGGEDTLGVASKLHQMGLPTVGVPKTMDNDLSGTDYTFGFDSAVSVGVDAADRLKDTARSHRRVMVLEVMGRHAGWVALEVGIAGGADWVLIPEVALDLDRMCQHLETLRARGRNYALIVVSEGVEVPAAESESVSVDAFGHVILRERGVGEFISKEIEARLKWESRLSVLGHIVRGGPPTPFDRMLATRAGIKAVDLVAEKQWGQMAALQGQSVVGVPLEEAVAQLKTVPLELYQELQVMLK